MNKENKGNYTSLAEVHSQSKDVVDCMFVWYAAKEMGFPVALWNLPNTQNLSLILNTKGTCLIEKPVLEELPAGFVISQFQNEDNAFVRFMESEVELTFDRSNTILSSESFQKTELTAQIFSRALELSTSYVDSFGELESLDDLEAKEKYEKSVVEGVQAIKSGIVKKIVLSRKKDFSSPKNFPIVEKFFTLVDSYPSAFVSVLYLPEDDEVWLGATPEVLVEVEQEGIFRTVALAGTQSAFNEEGGLIPRFEVRWGEKEIEEQALVGRYIIECFKKIRLREYLENGPKSQIAGNLYHLCSEFEVDMKAVNFPELGTVMLRLLHPTSAVCGMPKEVATNLVTMLESYDRSYYSGFLGPVNFNQNIRLFVNLRTVRFKNNIASFFAGAGITAESNPESEWNETEMKCETLLRFLR